MTPSAAPRVLRPASAASPRPPQVAQPPRALRLPQSPRAPAGGRPHASALRRSGSAAPAPRADARPPGRRLPASWCLQPACLVLDPLLICSWICHCSTALCEAASPEGSRGLAWSRQRGGASSTPQHPCPPPRASSIPLQGSGFGYCLSPPPSPRGRCLASGLGVGLQRRDGHCGTSHASEMVRMGQQHLTKVMTSSMLPNHRALVVQR